MKILVSACLLGMACRYDGRSKENAAVLALAERHTLVPCCPEVYGGLPIPREPSEIRGGRVYSRSGRDVTAQYEKGAQETVRLARLLRCDCALMQDRSPSCGCGLIHDGSFTDALVVGDGLTVQRLKANDIPVLPASRVDLL